MINSHQPFHLKYRPNNLDELVGQDLISITLKQALTSKRIAPAYLFSGPRGTGKTSSARIFAKSLNCLSFTEPNCKPCNKCELCKNIIQGVALDIIEIDAASNTGVENIREIIERAKFSPTQARWKVYVIDECHMLSTAASNALLKTIEEPPERVIFILATTNPERVLKTIHSRCQKFDFKRIKTEDIYKHLLSIASKEEIQYEDSAIRLIAKRSNGGMRDAQSTLDQLSLLPEGITKSNVENFLGEVSASKLIDLINSLIEKDTFSMLKSCSKLYDDGYEPFAILEGILNITRDLLLNITDDYSELFYTSSEFQSELKQISNKISKERIISWHSNLKNIEYQIKNSNQPRLWLEIHLSSLLAINNTEKYQAINIPKKDLNGTKNKQQLNSSSNEKKLTQNICEVNNVEKIETQTEDSNLQEENLIDDNKSIQLKEKWSLILSKIDLPSTRMLLSQQAELISIKDNYIQIALAPNWENMIKTRKILIENAVKKVFGENCKLNLLSSNNTTKNINIQRKEMKNNISSIKNEKNNDVRNDFKDHQDIAVERNNSKNLANFFNGEIIDIED